MKLTDGLFHKVFNEIGEEYPDIEKEVWIVDIGAAKLATVPEMFDVIVMENLYGDILSDVTAQMTGSVGLAGSANIGEKYAMFEAIHGSAPKHAGKNDANPSGLILASVMMLNHIKQPEVAALIHNAWLKTIEDGVHTKDIYRPETSKKKVGTQEFASEVISRLGSQPTILKPVVYKEMKTVSVVSFKKTDKKEHKELVGVDVFLDWDKGTAEDLGSMLSKIDTGLLKLLLISNRGIKVWPDGNPDVFCTDHWRCRYVNNEIGKIVTHDDIIYLLGKIRDSGFEFIKTENLYNFDGVAGYSLAQGQ